MNKLRRVDPDFYYEHIYENTDENHDMAKTKSKYKPEEVAKLKESHDYWQEIKLKAWFAKFKEAKRKSSVEAFEYLI